MLVTPKGSPRTVDGGTSRLKYAQARLGNDSQLAGGASKRDAVGKGNLFRTVRCQDSDKCIQHALGLENK